ncbi:MAG: glutamine--fructose-6-phosphate transaminase (isomerizing) [Bacteroidales bacterium]|nr:glutamine--fructose-6-phosphate transaminase (isomerizing) [Bacteroidales bacterium]MDD3988962.1 glutamine--fructose-6-phosphate transaminase (isomerizing) [Bacteroidales bacterium]MDD4639266.1 glutamine--fructose-6-phosphate transaminase (isomerizing) [Bacteroidales bacterium]
MCGIVGYVGYREAYPILIKGLQRLEYRGYDSAGIALVNKEGALGIYKTKGMVSQLEEFCSQKDLSGVTGIAHTRWATHGEPNYQNAHPHFSMSERIALIHNGIIENYAVLKETLVRKGFQFRSNTDTEVLVHLIDYIAREEHTDLCRAIQLALKQVIGTFAIAVLDADNPDTIIAARKSSPLVIGIGENEFFLASDASPIVEYTKDVVYLNDDEVAIMKKGEKLQVLDFMNAEKSHKIQHLELTINQLEKGDYEHFMLKEIFEQPRTLTDCMRGRINVEADNVVLSGVIDNSGRFKKAGRIIIVACGTSWHAALIGEHLIESLCRIPVEVEYASEFRYRNPVIYKDDIVIAISQSGETADTLAAVQLSRAKGAFIYGICNAVGSSIPRHTHSGSYIHVGPEIGVASTKAFTGQVTVLAMLALNIAKVKGLISGKELKNFIGELVKIPEKIETILDKNGWIKEFAGIFTYARNFIYLGRGFSYPVALEGALKLKEISYIHAEGYPAAEMKHGPIALIDSEMPVVVIATRNNLYDKVVSNIQEIKARNGKVIAIVTEGDKDVCNMADYCIEIPYTHEYLEPLLSVIPLQLLAYHIAVNKGRNVDRPRNLAKSVTVE